MSQKNNIKRKRTKTSLWINESENKHYKTPGSNNQYTKKRKIDPYERSSGYERNNFFGKKGLNTNLGKKEDHNEQFIPNEYRDEGDGFLVDDLNGDKTIEYDSSSSSESESEYDDSYLSWDDCDTDDEYKPK